MCELAVKPESGASLLKRDLSSLRPFRDLAPFLTRVPRDDDTRRLNRALPDSRVTAAPGPDSKGVYQRPPPARCKLTRGQCPMHSLVNK